MVRCGQLHPTSICSSQIHLQPLRSLCLRYKAIAVVFSQVKVHSALTDISTSNWRHGRRILEATINSNSIISGPSGDGVLFLGPGSIDGLDGLMYVCLLHNGSVSSSPSKGALLFASSNRLFREQTLEICKLVLPRGMNANCRDSMKTSIDPIQQKVSARNSCSTAVV